MGGKEMTMADVNRVMEQIGRYCEHAQIIMGAVVDAEMKSRLSVTVIAAKNAVSKSDDPADSSEPMPLRETAPQAAVRRTSPTPSLSLDQREQLVTRHSGRQRKASAKLLQTQLPLAIVSKGRFDKSEPTIHKGEDLDIPTYVRRGIALN